MCGVINGHEMSNVILACDTFKVNAIIVHIDIN